MSERKVIDFGIVVGIETHYEDYMQDAEDELVDQVCDLLKEGWDLVGVTHRTPQGKFWQAMVMYED